MDNVTRLDLSGFWNFCFFEYLDYEECASAADDVDSDVVCIDDPGNTAIRATNAS